VIENPRWTRGLWSLQGRLDLESDVVGARGWLDFKQYTPDFQSLPLTRSNGINMLVLQDRRF
jgi:hypothetical protein